MSDTEKQGFTEEELNNQVPETKPEMNTTKIEEATEVTEKLPAVELDKSAPAAAEEKKVLLPESKVFELIDTIKDLKMQVANYEAKEDKVADIIYSGMNSFGLIDKKTGEPIEALKQDRGVMKAIINAVKENISISDLMFNKKKAEEDLAKQFSFFSEMLPLFEDYAKRKKR